MDGSRLLLVRRKHEPKAGSWTLPGGRVEVGETTRQAICREVLEECGLIVEPVRLLDVVDFIETDSSAQVKFHYILIDYEVSVSGGEVAAGSDASDACWFQFADLDRIDIPQLTLDFLHRHYDFQT